MVAQRLLRVSVAADACAVRVRAAPPEVLREMASVEALEQRMWSELRKSRGRAEETAFKMRMGSDGRAKWPFY